MALLTRISVAPVEYKLIKVELDPVSFKIDLQALKRAVTVNTIM